MFEIEITEIALLVCGKNISATVLDYIANRMGSKDSLLHSESKGQVLDLTLLKSWSVKLPSSAVSQCGCRSMTHSMLDAATIVMAAAD